MKSVHVSLLGPEEKTGENDNSPGGSSLLAWVVCVGEGMGEGY